jgi:signal transduction histidine kinase
MGETEGQGLDLTLVRRIIERHHGRISLESEEGAGSRFIVALPPAVKSTE